MAPKRQKDWNYRKRGSMKRVISKISEGVVIARHGKSDSVKK